MNTIDLSGLRDIHLPQEPNWWPLALGWWIVIACGVICLMAGIGCFLYWWTRPKQYAMRSLKKTFRTEKNVILLAREVSNLLKRVALYNFSRVKVAQLTDQKWMDFLKENAPDSFSEDELTLLTQAVYMPETHMVKLSRNRFYHSANRALLALFRKGKNAKSSSKSL